jgi:hypothetical protein
MNDFLCTCDCVYINDFSCSRGRKIGTSKRISKGPRPIELESIQFLSIQKNCVHIPSSQVYIPYVSSSTTQLGRKKIVYYRLDRLANCACLLPHTHTHRSGSSHRKRGSPHRSWMAPQKRESCVSREIVPYVRGRKFTFSPTPGSLF